jgi:hypothetical protein
MQKVFLLAGLLTALSVGATGGTPKRIYMCEYDGGLDAFTWQATGESGAPPFGAAICSQPDGYHCDRVVDAQGNQLGGYPGRGSYCGSDSTSQSDYPNIKAYDP